MNPAIFKAYDIRGLYPRSDVKVVFVSKIDSMDVGGYTLLTVIERVGAVASECHRRAARKLSPGNARGNSHRKKEKGVRA